MGVQPAKLILVSRRIHMQDAASAIGFSYWWFRQVLHGERLASAKFRTLLAEFLDVAEADPFNYDGAGRRLVPSP